MNKLQSKGRACRAPLALCAMLFALCASAPGCRTYYITVRPIGIVNNLQTDIPVTKTVSGSLPVSIIPK